MTTTLTGTIQQNSKFQLAVDGADNATGTYAVSNTTSYTTGGTVLTKPYVKNLTITSTPTVLDLTTGLTNTIVGSLVFGHVVVIQIQNAGAVSLLIGGGTNALIPAFTVTAKGSFCLDSTLLVDATHKLISLSTASSTTTADVIIIGY